MSEKTKDILLRAAKTFWQAAVGYLLADTALLREALEGAAGLQIWALLLTGAAAAGLSALYNGLLRPALEMARGRE